MPVTFLTTEDANAIIEKLADIQRVIDKLDVKVGSMNRYDEQMVSAVSDLNYNFSILFSNKQYKEFKKPKQLSVKNKKRAKKRV